MKIDVRHLSKSYKGKQALDDVSFTLEEPKIYGLLGRNGAGKTTFMQILAGLILPANGSILVDGVHPFDNQHMTESMCLIKEGNNFKKELKVKNVLTISSLFYPNWDAGLASELIEEFSLNPDAKVKTLSKGMESALGVIVGLASKAQITMFDEPYIGLDAAARNRFYELLVEDFERQKRTIIFSTHLIDEVSLLFEEILIFQDGKLILQEDADKVRDTSYSVTGPVEQVTSFIKNKQVIHQKRLAGSMTAIVYGEEQEINPPGLSVEGIPIQDVMVHLTSSKGGAL